MHESAKNAEDQAFRVRTASLASAALCGLSAFVVVVQLVQGDFTLAAVASVISVSALGSLVLAQQGQVAMSLLLLVSVVAVATGVAEYHHLEASMRGLHGGPLVGLVFLATILAGERVGLAACVLAVLSIAAAGAGDVQRLDSWMPVARVVAESAVVVAFLAAGVSVRRRSDAKERTLRARAATQQHVADVAKRIAARDLTLQLTADDDLSRAILAMQRELRETVGELQESARVIVPATEQIAGMANENERLASNQAAVLGQTRSTLRNLAESARAIQQNSGEVTGNAEKVSTRTTELTHAFDDLGRLYARIEALLKTLVVVARKGETLALNAALEGIRAGEAGKGFSLVANEMQALASQSRVAATEGGTLIGDIQDGLQRVREELERAREGAHTNAELARQISGETTRQQFATDTMVIIIEELVSDATQLSRSAGETLAMTQHLQELSERVRGVAGRYET